jgi:hypothetical protein
MGTHSNYALRMPNSLKQGVSEFAQQDGTSINQFIVSAIAEKLASLAAVDYFVNRAKQGDVNQALAMLSRAGGQAPQAGDELL